MNEIVKKLVYEVIVKAAITRLVAAIPFLNLPIVNPLTVYFLGRFAEHLYDVISLYITFQVIDFQTAHQKIEYERAVSELLKAQQSQNKEEQDRAKAEFKKRLGDLIHFPK